MRWEFWQSTDNSMVKRGNSKLKRHKANKMPNQIGKYLVTQEKADPDWVWTLKCVLRPRAGSKTCFYFRVFSDSYAQDAHVDVANYYSLDTNPELIIYHGWYDKRSKQIEILQGMLLLL